jgi:poly(A) polymerase
VAPRPGSRACRLPGTHHAAAPCASVDGASPLLKTALPRDTLLALLPPPCPAPAIDPSHLDVASLKVIARLRRYGHTAYLVGGCVRDLLAGVQPKDFDVATSAHPEDIRNIFRNSRLIGRRFRLAHVFFPGGHFVEVATFRSNPVPEADASPDGTETEAVDLLVTDDNQFGTAEEDARRRDFTVNGLFYDVVEGKVIDYVGGLADLKLGAIRTIGDPEIRFREDPVRGLRAARIAAKLAFRIEDETFAAMIRHAGELPRCAPARVLDETLKLLRSGTSSPAFKTLRRAGILQYLLPPIEDVLLQGGPEAESAFLKRLSTLDAFQGEKRVLPDAVLLATLLSFLPMMPPRVPVEESEEEEPDDLAGALPSADRVLAQMSSQARLPRKVADRVRAIIGSQRYFHAPARKRRRRGSGGFVRTPHFADALQLFEIVCHATGEHSELVAQWKHRSAQQKEPSPHVPDQRAAPSPPPAAAPVVAAAPAPASENGAPAPAGAPKKRRRRGGRGRRKVPAAAPVATPPDSGGGAPT